MANPARKIFDLSQFGGSDVGTKSTPLSIFAAVLATQPYVNVPVFVMQLRVFSEIDTLTAGDRLEVNFLADMMERAGQLAATERGKEYVKINDSHGQS
jgi:hypothetical protein